MKKSEIIRIDTQKITMTDGDCEEISQIITKHCGIKLGISKKTMIQSRMDRRLMDLGLNSYQAYIQHLKKHNHEYENLINAITTNKTEFWREQAHFKKLMAIITKEYSQKTFVDPMFIWSAASSTGEEAYSMAIMLEEYRIHNPAFVYKILGSDIDTAIIEKASKGVYTKSVISGVLPQHISRYFDRGIGKNSGFYKVKDILKRNIKYRYHNLINSEDTVPLKFDVIFLRNVLIYFEPENIQKTIDKLTSHLKPGGYLFIGHSETLNGINHKLKNISGSVFKKINNDKTHK